MDTVLAARSIGISELREAPAKAFEQAVGEAVMVLNHNKPAGYILSPRLMAAFLDAMADRAVVEKAAPRLRAWPGPAAYRWMNSEPYALAIHPLAERSGHAPSTAA